MTRIGLALGGGAVRGMAHIGVLEVLERHNFPIDFVAGTSAGALMGAVYCAQCGLKKIKEVAAEASWRRMARFTLSSRGFFCFDRLETWLVELLGDLTFADLEIPLAVVTTDMQTGEAVIIREGRLAPAVRASCSVPGLVTPVALNGRLLGDGALVDNLPVAIARQMGAEYVIAVNVAETSYKRRWGPPGQGMAAVGTLIRNAGGGVYMADCLITPELAGFSYVRFSQRERLIAAGVKAAEEQLRLPARAGF